MNLKKHIKGFILIFIFMFTYSILMGISSRTIQGYILSTQGLITAIIGIVLYLHMKELNYEKESALLISLVFILTGISDVAWGVSYFILNLSSKNPISSFLTEFGYSFAYLFGTVGILKNIQGSFKKFMIRKYALIPFVVILSIALVLTLKPLFIIKEVSFISVFNISELFAIFSSLIFIFVCLLSILSSRQLGWSLFTAGMLCFLFSDWALRFDKLIGHSPSFNIGSFCYTFGLYVSSIPIFFDKKFEKIESFSTNSISSNYRLGTFIMVSFFSSFIYFNASEHQSALLLKNICLAFGIGAILVVYIDLFLSEKVKSVSDYMGHLLLSEFGATTEFQPDTHR